MSWNYNFKKSHKQDWLQQAFKDKPLLNEDELYPNIQNTIKGLAFATREDIEQNIVKFDQIRKSNWKIGTIIQSGALSSTKKSIDYSLIHGVEYINVLSNEIKNSDSLEILLEDVLLDAVDIAIPLDSFDFRDYNYNKFNSIRFYSADLNKIDLATIETLKKLQISYVLEFKTSEILQAKKIIEQLSPILKDLLHIKIQVIIYFNKSILINIAFYRALSKKLSDMLPNCCFEIRPDETIIDPNIYNNLIVFSAVALSASLCGTDIISLPPYDVLSDSKDNIWLRNSIHLQHIFKSEAKLNQVIDPVQGSYYIEDLSFKIHELLNHED